MKMIAAAIPMCLLVVQAMPAPGANSSLIAASIHFDSRPQTSTARLQWPAFLFGVHHEVISLLSARAASCDTQGACAHDDAEQVSPMAQQDWSSAYHQRKRQHIHHRWADGSGRLRPQRCAEQQKVRKLEDQLEA